MWRSFTNNTRRYSLQEDTEMKAVPALRALSGGPIPFGDLVSNIVHIKGAKVDLWRDADPVDR
jgi:hypothetical protein